MTHIPGSKCSPVRVIYLEAAVAMISSGPHIGVGVDDLFRLTIAVIGG